jgi:Fic family protein
MKKLCSFPEGIYAILYLDGNGRVGQLLIVLLLCEWELPPRPLLNLSAYIEHYRQEYCVTFIGEL